MIFKHIHALILRMITYEKSPTRLAFTCALGIYIGISPLVGLHTALVFICGWIFSLSIPVLFMVSMMIHNPWTMMPVYAIDHLFGKWLFTFFNIEHGAWDPIWIESCNLFLKEHTGITGLSLSAFLVGGNLLAIGTSVMLYPVMKRVFTKYLNAKVSNAVSDTALRVTYENNISKQKSILTPRNTSSFAKATADKSFLRGEPH